MPNLTLINPNLSKNDDVHISSGVNSINAIMAVTSNWCIAHNGKIPWYMPSDLKRFKNLTSGHILIMGRKTFDSIGHPLKHRVNIVLTSEKLECIPKKNLYFTNDISVALNWAQNVFLNKHIFIIGGKTLWESCYDLIDFFHITTIPIFLSGGLCLDQLLISTYLAKCDMKLQIYTNDKEDDYPSTYSMYKKHTCLLCPKFNIVW